MIAMTPEQRKTLELLLPNSVPAMKLIVPRGNLPEQLHAEILPSDSPKILVAGQRGMGKTTELRRLVEALNGSEFLPIFLQFGAQESISHSGLIRAMAHSLYLAGESKLDKNLTRIFSSGISTRKSSLWRKRGLKEVRA